MSDPDVPDGPDAGPLGRPAEGLERGLEGRRIRADLKARMFGATTQAPRLGPYRITGKLGEGGVGSVYRCTHEDTGETAAVKVLRSETEAAAMRLRREGKAMAQLRHRHIVQLREIGVCEEGVFIAMELVEGPSMRGWMQRPRTAPQIVAIVAQAASGLQAAHELGVVHRDIKPDNILVDRSGHARITDFGLVKALPDSDAQALTAFGQPLTATGAMLGTVGYMAPEQLRGDDVTPAVDQFALAVTAFEALCGHLPFRGKSADAVALAILRGRVHSPAKAQPDPLAAVLHRALRIAPDERFASIDEFARALIAAPPRAPAALSRGGTARSRRRGR